MNHVSIHEETAFNRIAAIVEDLVASNNLYSERLDKQEMTQHIVNLFSEAETLSNLNQINQEDLTNRINSILVLHSIAGTLNDLTPEEMAVFDEAVGR
jgi:hypothetical protein